MPLTLYPNEGRISGGELVAVTAVDFDTGSPYIVHFSGSAACSKVLPRAPNAIVQSVAADKIEIETPDFYLTMGISGSQELLLCLYDRGLESLVGGTKFTALARALTTAARAVVFPTATNRRCRHVRS